MVGRLLGALADAGRAALSPSPGEVLAGPVGQALACAVAAGACHGLAELVARRSATTQEGVIRARALRHLISLGPTRSVTDRTGSHVHALTDGAERVAAYRQTFLAPTFAALAGPVTLLAVLAVAVDAPTALALLAAVILMPPVVAATHRLTRRSSAGSRRARAQLAAAYLDVLQALTAVSLARCGPRTVERLRREGEENRRAVMRILAANQLIIILTDGLFSLLLVTGAALLALHRLSLGAIDLGQALGLVLVSLILLGPLERVGSFFYVAMGGRAYERLLRRLHATRAVDGAPLPPGQPVTLEAEADVISLDRVSARWSAGGPWVLRDLSLRVRPGERVAIVGTSGAGKSTLLALLGGDLLPGAGVARVAGVAVTAQTLDTVRALSAVVAQRTWLCSGTVADNLRVAVPEATPEQMWRALATAQLDDDVRCLPAGLDTPVGEQGARLSGGQAQRLSVARAVLADRPVLILDEPTSHVDAESEARLVAALDAAAAGRTVITVSHREAALAGADRVLRLVEGRLEEVA